MKSIKSIIVFIMPFAIITAVFLTIYAAMQQSIRQGANMPQVQLAEDAALALSHGATPASVIPQGAQVDASRSLAPFILVTDDKGSVLASSGTLGDKPYAVPQGIFAFLDDRNERRITLEPLPGVRIASDIIRFYEPSGANGIAVRTGYVIAGRNLREAENMIQRIGLMILLGYAASMIGWAIRCAALRRTAAQD